jgi:hypothetical protein
MKRKITLSKRESNRSINSKKSVVEESSSNFSLHKHFVKKLKSRQSMV